MTDFTSTPHVSVASPGWRTPALAGARLVRGVTTLLAVLVVFTAITAVLFWPCLAHLRSALIGPPEDNMNDFWDTWYVVASHDPAHFFFTKLLHFPEGTSLLYQSFAWPQLFAVAVLGRFFGTDLHTLAALQNVTLLASFPLAGVGAFYLVRHLVGCTVGGLIGGFVFAFNPSHVAHTLHHAGVASIEFLPLFVLCYLLALERRSYAWLAGAAIFTALSALSCWYYLFYCAYFMGFQMLYERVRDGAWPRGWSLTAPPICLLAVAVMLAPLLLPMLLATAPSVYADGGNTAVADLLAFIAFPPQHLLSGITSGLYARFTGYAWESTAYLGLVNIAILVLYLFRTGLARASLNMYVASGALIFAILSCGEALHVGGAVTFIHLPDVVLDKLPFFANVRAPSRAIVFAYLFLGIGVGAVAAAIWRQSAIAARGAAIVLAALMVLDFWPANFQFTPIARSAGLSLLTADKEAGFGVLNLPIGYVEENDYMLEQIYHGRPMMGGNTARQMANSLINHLPLANLPQEHDELVRAHVKYILIHNPVGNLYAWDAGLPPVAQYLKAYRNVYHDAALTILRVY